MDDAASARPQSRAPGSVRLLYDIRKGRMPAEPIIDSRVDVVTAENVDAYLEE